MGKLRPVIIHRVHGARYDRIVNLTKRSRSSGQSSDHLICSPNSKSFSMNYDSIVQFLLSSKLVKYSVRQACQHK